MGAPAAGISGENTGPVPVVPLQACPINASLGTLGRKWTLTIIRDIAFWPGTNFSSIRRNNPGLRQRTLSLRLRELADAGLIDKHPAPNGNHGGRYELTAKGREIWPVLASLVQYGVRNFPATVFADGKARDIEQVFPGSADLMLGHLAEFARTDGVSRRETARSHSSSGNGSNGRRRS